MTEHANGSVQVYSSHSAGEFNEKNTGGHPIFQHCQQCGVLQYPSREVCRECLSADLTWKPVNDDLVEVVSVTKLTHSLEPFYLNRLPWYVASVRLRSDNSGTLMVHVAPGVVSGTTLKLTIQKDDRDAAVLFAVDPESDADQLWKSLIES